LNPDSGVSWIKAGTVGAGPYQNFRTNFMIDTTHLSDTTGNMVVQNINNMFYTILLSTTNSYGIDFNIGESFFHESYQLLRYRGGQEYTAHYDGGTYLGRCISALCYLNDDYEGGELEFVNFNQAQGTECELQYTQGTIAQAIGVLLEDFTFTFTPINLDPGEPPVVLEVYNE
jgi:hypothetical protein